MNSTTFANSASDRNLNEIILQVDRSKRKNFPDASPRIKRRIIKGPQMIRNEFDDLRELGFRSEFERNYPSSRSVETQKFPRCEPPYKTPNNKGAANDPE